MTCAGLRGAHTRDIGALRSGLLLALALAVTAAIVVQALLASLVAQRSVLRDTAAAAHSRAAQLEDLLDAASGSPSPALTAWVEEYARAPEVVAARVVDDDGTPLAYAPAGAPAALWREHLMSTANVEPWAVWRSGTVHVVVPLHHAAHRQQMTGQSLEVVLAGPPIAVRIHDLHRAVLAIVAAGGVLVLGLWVLFAGRAAVDRRREPIAATDDLTGLPGRRRFEEDLQDALEHARRTDDVLSVALLDLNGVSGVRDADGRRVADSLVRRVADLIQQTGEKVYCVAGDGFALILPGEASSSARVLLERLALDVTRCAAPLTADVGVAHLPAEGASDADFLLIRAQSDLADARERREFARVHAHGFTGEDPLDEPVDPWEISWLPGPPGRRH